MATTNEEAHIKKPSEVRRAGVRLSPAVRLYKESKEWAISGRAALQRQSQPPRHQCALSARKHEYYTNFTEDTGLDEVHIPGNACLAWGEDRTSVWCAPLAGGAL